MTCSHCGLELIENAKFCPRCGAPATPPPKTPTPPPAQDASTPPACQVPVRKKKGSATVCFALLSLILAVVLVLQNLGIIGLIGETDRSSARMRMEGAGYASAEEAVEAYINALKQGDVPAALSTFAIETYVDSYDTQAGLFYTGAWLPAVSSDGTYELLGSDYERQLRCFSRQASITQKLYGQLINYSAYFQEEKIFLNNENGTPVAFREEEDVKEFLRVYRESSFGKALAEMELKDFVDPKDLCEAYGSEAHLKNMSERGQLFGCDEYKSVAARISLNGETWLLTMDCICYGGRWYNLSQSSVLSNMLGASVYLYGLIPYSITGNSLFP
ncbi:MAG: zinc ribbon domain-containing protein [Lachnospiraceae bacterium]|nr:zinc ribbon domain-containing protein [Lachnospiraceae bacterium]